MTATQHPPTQQAENEGTAFDDFCRRYPDYLRTSTFTHMPGGTVTVNFYDPDGHLFDWRKVEAAANLEQISLRTGCFCNPGGGRNHQQVDPSRYGNPFQDPDPHDV